MKLFCSRCGYILQTSSAEADAVFSCPECGAEATVESLQAHKREMADISGLMMRSLLVWPGIMLGVSVIPLLSLILIPIFGLTGIIFTARNAGRLARRLTWTRAANALETEDFNPKDPWRIAALFASFWFVQFLLMTFAVFAGCSMMEPLLSMI